MDTCLPAGRHFHVLLFAFGLDTAFKLVAVNSKQFSFFVTAFGWTPERLEEHSGDGTCLQQGVWRYWGWTLLASTFCSLLCFSPGLTFFNLAFSCYLQLQFFNWASVMGGRFSNPPTTPSPTVVRKQRHPTLTKHFLYIIIAIGLFNQSVLSQNSNKTKGCYSDKPFDKEKVFTKMLHKPYFKGGHDTLINFLMTNISFQKLVNDLSQNERLYNDTARVKFVVAKNGALSDLTVTLTKKKFLADEIIRVIKKSSCNWVAGGTERLLNGWLQFDIYYLIDRRYNEVTTKIKIKEYDFATDN